MLRLNVLVLLDDSPPKTIITEIFNDRKTLMIVINSIIRDGIKDYDRDRIALNVIGTDIGDQT